MRNASEMGLDGSHREAYTGPVHDSRAISLLADIRLFFPSKMSIISTPPGLETVKDLGIVKETKKVFEIRLQKLHFGEFQEIQLIIVQNR
jgi:hypothetical protein